MSRDPQIDPDDLFADTRMTFGDHLEDLRNHLIRAIYGFVAGMVIALFFANRILGWITGPVDQELLEYHQRHTATRLRVMEEKIKNGEMDALPQVRLKAQIREIRQNGVPDVPPDPKAVLPQLVPAFLDWLEQLDFDGLRDPSIAAGVGLRNVELIFANPAELAGAMQKLSLITKPPSLTTLSIQEPFVVFFKIAIMAGFVISAPIVFWQIWSFVAAGLFPHEKRLVHVYLPISLLLFVIGVLVCQFVVIPKAIAALLWFNELLEVTPDLRLNEWLGFAIFMPVVFGLSFQTPLVMLFAYMVGVVDIPTYQEKRKMAFFLMAIFAAFITPSTDAFSMMFMWIPMCFLYEIGIWMCMFKKREEQHEWDEDESHEMVEV